MNIARNAKTLVVVHISTRSFKRYIKAIKYANSLNIKRLTLN